MLSLVEQFVCQRHHAHDRLENAGFEPTATCLCGQEMHGSGARVHTVMSATHGAAAPPAAVPDPSPPPSPVPPYRPAGAGALAAGRCSTGPTGGSAGAAAGEPGFVALTGFGPTGVALVGRPAPMGDGSPAGVALTGGRLSEGAASLHGLHRPHVASHVPRAM
jgi:hypothetical protein